VLETVGLTKVVGYLPGELKLPGRVTALHDLSFLGRVRGGLDERVVHANSPARHRVSARRRLARTPSCPVSFLLASDDLLLLYNYTTVYRILGGKDAWLCPTRFPTSSPS
jgi:hypothetical protein